VKECQHCQAELGGLRERVSLGAQFVFADASPRRPVSLSLDSEEPQVFAQPTLISRHRHGIGFGETYVRPTRRRQKPPQPGVDLPPVPARHRAGRLTAPGGPDLTAVITERKIYRPKDETHIFIAAPAFGRAPGGEVEMEVQLTGQQITKERGAGQGLPPPV